LQAIVKFPPSMAGNFTSACNDRKRLGASG
jgi:hypothetical protein